MKSESHGSQKVTLLDYLNLSDLTAGLAKRPKIIEAMWDYLNISRAM